MAPRTDDAAARAAQGGLALVFEVVNAPHQGRPAGFVISQGSLLGGLHQLHPRGWVPRSLQLPRPDPRREGWTRLLRTPLGSNRAQRGVRRSQVPMLARWAQAGHTNGAARPWRSSHPTDKAVLTRDRMRPADALYITYDPRPGIRQRLVEEAVPASSIE